MFTGPQQLGLSRYELLKHMHCADQGTCKYVQPGDIFITRTLQTDKYCCCALLQVSPGGSYVATFDKHTLLIWSTKEAERRPLALHHTKAFTVSSDVLQQVPDLLLLLVSRLALGLHSCLRVSWTVEAKCRR